LDTIVKPDSPKSISKNISLSLVALGVVYGDIGTSPLYAMRESLQGVVVNANNILGVLSLIFWTLFLVITVKYIFVVLRADNNGEGGALALLALLKNKAGKSYTIFLILGMLGAGFLLGDGMLTPAISVMSAIEGLKIVSPAISYLIMPLTLFILVGLFYFQYLGPAKLGRYFGPLILIWFLIIGIFGLNQLIQNLHVLVAINPIYGMHFLLQNGFHGYALLGGVFLAVTGGEALYADLGHFGKTPIRIGWFSVVWPGLLLNYFGQGAYLLKHPEAITNPFYSLAPHGFSYILLIIATLTCIIASQAVISAIFSIARQGVLLQFIPRLTIVQTAEDRHGQVYLPQINFLLAIGALFLVIFFKNSSTLSHAYGLTINLEMLIVTVMVLHVAQDYWHWSLKKVIPIFAVFLTVDMAFLGANLQKIVHGGWLPLLIAVCCAIIMYTCNSGLKYLSTIHYRCKNHLDKIPPSSLDTITIFVTHQYESSENREQNFLRLIEFLPNVNLIVSVVVESIPYVPINKRCRLHALDNNETVYKLDLHYGFMQLINVPLSLYFVNKMKILPFHLNIDKTIYLMEITLVTATRRKDTLLMFWQEKLFAFLVRNAEYDIEFYRLPYDRTIAIGTYYEI
jgi:KUP system potassium uptake protein